MVIAKWISPDKGLLLAGYHRLHCSILFVRNHALELATASAGIVLLLYAQNDTQSIVIYLVISGILYCRWIYVTKKIKADTRTDTKTIQNRTKDEFSNYSSEYVPVVDENLLETDDELRSTNNLVCSAVKELPFGSQSLESETRQQREIILKLTEKQEGPVSNDELQNLSLEELASTTNGVLENLIRLASDMSKRSALIVDKIDNINANMKKNG